MSKIQPIRPDEVTHEIPDFVIKIVNDLIKENWNGNNVYIAQKELVDAIESAPEFNLTCRKDIFRKHWLDFEELYQNAGWNVVYKAPAIGENFEPYFKFLK